MKIDYRFSVAPMMGYTTPHARYFYRLLSKKSILFTEMVASQSLLKGDERSLVYKNKEENPTILQVGGSEENELIHSVNLADKYGLFILEDAAHALETVSNNNIKVGDTDHAAAFSFYANKNCTLYSFSSSSL